MMESVPPRFYGGTERIASYLTEELVAQGHDVTLFASGDSITAAKLVPCCTQALRLNKAVRDPIPYYMLMLDKVRRRAFEFDIVHFHMDQFHFPIFRDVAHRTITTLHGRQDLPDMLPLYAGFPEMQLVSISNAQRKPIPDASYVATVYHGLPQDLLTPTLRPRGGYLAFVGRISPEKRVDRAIRIARAVGIPLKIAAKVDRVDVEYFKAEIEPLLAGPGVEFIGEIDERRKPELPGRGTRVAVSHRLAGTVRSGHDRGDGLRHTGARFPQWLGCRSHRRGRDGLSSWRAKRKPFARSAHCWRWTEGACGGASTSASLRRAWQPTMSRSTRNWSPRPLRGAVCVSSRASGTDTAVAQ